MYQSPSVAGPRQKRQKKKGTVAGGGSNRSKDDQPTGSAQVSASFLSQRSSEGESGGEGGEGGRRGKDRGKERRRGIDRTTGKGGHRTEKHLYLTSSASESDTSDGGDASSINLKQVLGPPKTKFDLMMFCFSSLEMFVDAFVFIV